MVNRTHSNGFVSWMYLKSKAIRVKSLSTNDMENTVKRDTTLYLHAMIYCYPQSLTCKVASSERDKEDRIYGVVINDVPWSHSNSPPASTIFSHVLHWRQLLDCYLSQTNMAVAGKRESTYLSASKLSTSEDWYVYSFYSILLVKVGIWKFCYLTEIFSILSLF